MTEYCTECKNFEHSADACEFPPLYLTKDIFTAREEATTLTARSGVREEEMPTEGGGRYAALSTDTSARTSVSVMEDVERGGGGVGDHSQETDVDPRVSMVTAGTDCVVKPALTGPRSTTYVDHTIDSHRPIEQTECLKVVDTDVHSETLMPVDNNRERFNTTG